MREGKRWRWLPVVSALLLTLSLPLAQELSTGTIEGKVTDEKGQSVPGATISATGPQGTKNARSGADGRYRIPFLPVGKYDLRVEMTGYATMIIKDVEVLLNRRTNMPIQVSAGTTETVEVTAEAPMVDPKQTSTGANIRIRDFVEYVPVGRTYSDTFAIAPGVVSGGGTGAGNYSISGASGLENQYYVDGVNITNTGYGGIGAYNIVYGSLGTGVTYDFLEEVQVKTGGFEAEFGGATGGVLNTTVKSGSNTFGGSVGFFFQPRSLQAEYNKVDLTLGAVNQVDTQVEDLAVSVGGPIVPDRLFYFAAYNPVRTKDRFTIQAAPFEPAFAPPGVSTFPAARLGPQERERMSNNYAAKISWLVSPNHRVELTTFGDPSKGDRGPQLLTSFDRTDPQALQFLDYSRGGGQSEIKYGGNNYAIKYNGVFGNEFFGEFQVSLHDAKFRESPTLNQNRVRDRRQQLCFLFPLFGCPPGVSASAPTVWFTGGPGFLSRSDDENMTWTAKLTNILGPVELKYGIEYADIEYTDQQGYSGESVDFFVPADRNFDGVLSVGEGVVLKSNTGTLIDFRGVDSRGNNNYRATRNRLNPFPGPTTTKDLNVFVQATWSVTPRITINPGVRVTRQEIEGSGGGFSLPFATSPVTGVRTATAAGTGCGSSGTKPCRLEFDSDSYTFDTEFAPRIGATWDVNGDGRSKLYANLGRYYERIPNDLAVRALSTEISTVVYQFRTLGPNNVPLDPDPMFRPNSTIFFNGLDPTLVQKGTKLPYKDEAVLGYAYQIRPNISFEARAIYRKQGRTLEDVQFASNEAIQNYYYGVNYGYPYDPFGGSPANPVSTSFPAESFGAYVLANPGENTPEEAGFPEPTHKYKALELILNRRLSENWLFYGNYRYSRLRGNYEGLFRNDNTQSDPNITSLLDFPNSPTMRGQFASGPLNTDRPHVLNLYAAYVWDGGLSIGGSFNWHSGVPRTPLLAHPNYQNSGEIPGINPVYFWWVDTDGDGAADTGRRGTANQFFNDPQNVLVTPILIDYTDCKRGCLGRTPDTATVNVNIGYAWKIGDTSLDLGMSIFNLFDSKEPVRFDDNVESTAGIPDPDFGRITDFQLPRTYRFSARYRF